MFDWIEVWCMHLQSYKYIYRVYNNVVVSIGKYAAQGYGKLMSQYA